MKTWNCECGGCLGCVKIIQREQRKKIKEKMDKIKEKIIEEIYHNIEHPRELTPKEKAEKSFERFMSKLMSAIHLTGGTLGGWENKTIKEIYEDLHPNGIHLKFSLDFDNKDRTYSGD